MYTVNIYIQSRTKKVTKAVIRRQPSCNPAHSQKQNTHILWCFFRWKNWLAHYNIQKFITHAALQPTQRLAPGFCARCKWRSGVCRVHHGGSRWGDRRHACNEACRNSWMDSRSAFHGVRRVHQRCVSEGYRGGGYWKRGNICVQKHMHICVGRWLMC